MRMANEHAESFHSIACMCMSHWHSRALSLPISYVQVGRVLEWVMMFLAQIYRCHINMVDPCLHVHVQVGRVQEARAWFEEGTRTLEGAASVALWQVGRCAVLFLTLFREDEVMGLT